jgi:uncharacterized membrane protein YphA (DoxX/SURF4 family)
MMDALRRDPVLRIVRIAAGLVFVAAALAKIGDPAAFSLAVHNYRMTPAGVENVIALVLPWIELLAGLALVLDVRARAGAVITLALMILFTALVGSAWARGLDFECGCFGKASAGHIGAKKFFENVGLTALAAVASLRRSP